MRSTRQKPAVKTELLLQQVRERLLTGVFAPGSRLPPQGELMADFGVGKSTVQRAIRTLAAEGFLEVRGVAGTYVAARPPHRNCIGLVFPWSQAELSYSHFYCGLRQVAETLGMELGLTFKPYYRVGQDGHSGDMAPLLADAAEGRLAGVVFTMHPGEAWNRLRALPRTLPAVTIARQPPPGLRGVAPDVAAFRELALQRLAALGCRRVGWITLLFDDEAAAERRAASERQGLESRPYWNQQVLVQSARTLRTTVPCLLHLPAAERPDALIIEDDNLVEDVQFGLAAAGAAAARLHIIAAGNFPCLPERRLDLTWLGYDLEEILRGCLNALQAARERQPFPATTLIPPRFELPAQAQEAVA